MYGILTVIYLGYPENSRDHSTVPGGAQPARPDLTTVAIFWDIIGEQSAEQVRGT